MRDLTNFMSQYWQYIVYFVLSIIILRAMLRALSKNYHSRWSILIENFSFSSQEFYSLLKEELQAHSIEGIDTKFVSLKEGNAFSSSRIYLRVTWKDYDYDICGAPFGDGFFISWWLLYKIPVWQKVVIKIPFIGGWLGKTLFPVTYYKIDTASMFMTFAQSKVLEVIKTITKDSGFRGLTESERKPILQDILIR